MTAVGLDLGGTALKYVVLDSRDDVVERGQVPVRPGDALDLVVRTARELISGHSSQAVGVGLAGLVTYPDGEFVWGPHLSGHAVPYRAALRDALGFAVAVDNDANLAAHAEWFVGAGEQVDPMVMVTLGTGIGVGCVIDGQVYRGASFAGEAGHIEMLPDGGECSCGRRGCWETLVSGAVLDRSAAELAVADPTGPVAIHADGSPSTGVHLALAAEAGDVGAVRALSEAGGWLGRGIANLILMLDPRRVVVGGAAAAAGPILFSAARQVVAAAMSGSAFRTEVPIVPARFGTWSGAVGAALAGRRVHNGRDEW
ncbi:MAG: ROK family protein [Acidimicrobiia bacterium]